MNSRYDRENDLRDLHDPDGQDHEISLGTATIVGIFFALALLCAVFFGFGYSLGRHSAQPVASAADTNTEPDSGSTKPSPGSLSNQGRNGSSSAEQAGDAGQAETTQDDSSAKVTDKAPQEREPSPVKAVISNPGPDAHAAPAAKTSATRSVIAAPVTGAASPGAPVVQVAAVSHQEDANILASALKQRGYNVVIRQMPQDKLLHVQVGPFASKKDADAMRQRLQGDGYNAIVK